MAEDDLDRPETAEALSEALVSLAGKRGFHRVLDDVHTVTYRQRGGALLVTFEEVEATLARETGLPLAFDFGESKSWSVLHVTANRRSWFRSPDVFAFFDELADDVFFDEYDRVIFYGAGPGGYAAAAYSVAAPGARVIAVAPLATVDRDRAAWDKRFRASLEPPAKGAARYAYAPEMVEAAEAAFILFDPALLFDHVHARLFQGSNVTHVPAHGLGRMEVPPLEQALEEIGALHPVIEGFGLGTLRPSEAYALFRARRDHPAYLRTLLSRAQERGSDRLVALLCMKVLSRGKAPLFRRRLRDVRARLEAAEALPAWLR